MTVLLVAFFNITLPPGEIIMKAWLEESYWQRHRSIRVAKNGDRASLTAAKSCLEAMPGVISAGEEQWELHVDYDIRKIDLPMIRSTITDYGLTINENIRERFSRWIIEYKESIRRAEENVSFGWDTWIQAAYVNRYRLRRHGRRDDRLTNWRQYEITNPENKPLDAD